MNRRGLLLALGALTIAAPVMASTGAPTQLIAASTAATIVFALGVRLAFKIGRASGWREGWRAGADIAALTAVNTVFALNVRADPWRCAELPGAMRAEFNSLIVPAGPPRK